MANDLMRFSVAMPEDLLVSFDRLVSRRGLAKNRSEVVRDLGGSVLDMAALPKAKHVFTHVEWHMTGGRVELAQRDGLQGDWHWTSDAQRGEGYAVPSAYRAYLG